MHTPSAMARRRERLAARLSCLRTLRSLKTLLTISITLKVQRSHVARDFEHAQCARQSVRGGQRRGDGDGLERCRSRESARGGGG